MVGKDVVADAQLLLYWDLFEVCVDEFWVVEDHVNDQPVQQDEALFDIIIIKVDFFVELLVYLRDVVHKEIPCNRLFNEGGIVYSILLFFVDYLVVLQFSLQGGSLDKLVV